MCNTVRQSDGCSPMPMNLPRPSDTLSPSGGEGWGEGVLWFTESPLSLLRMHWDHEPRRWVRRRDSVLDCGSPLPLLRPRSRSKSARGLAQSKTWRRFGWFMEREQPDVAGRADARGQAKEKEFKPAPPNDKFRQTQVVCHETAERLQLDRMTMATKQKNQRRSNL